MAALTKTVANAELGDCHGIERIAKSRIILLRSFFYSIADGREKPIGDQQRSASRNISQAVGEFNE